MIQSCRNARALLALLVLAAPAGAVPADPPQSPSPPQPPACREAVVSPVSGHAECVAPRGAPVEQPQRKDLPCIRRKPDEATPCADDAQAKNPAPR